MFLYLKLSLLVGILSSCTNFTLPEFNNVTADKAETLAKNEDLAAQLESLSIPNDSKFHFGGNISREHDKLSGEPIGWSIEVSAKFGLPRILPTPCPTCWTDDNGVTHNKGGTINVRRRN